jgi:thioredoxin reductase (NADPH)
MRPRLLIVGAGPAGVSGALWGRERFDVTVIERAARPGGQLRAIHVAPRGLLGGRVRNGSELAEICARQLARPGIELRCGAGAAALERPRTVRGKGGGGAPLRVRLEDGRRIAADAILIATGLRRRRLGIPGEAELAGRGLSVSATRDRARLAGRRVLVVGGGDGAFENALHLAAAGSQVVMAVRGRPRARRDFRQRVAGSPRIRVLTDTRVTAFLGRDRLRGACLEGPHGRIERPFEGAVVKIGWDPDSEWCADAVRTDRAGFVRVDARGRTSADRVWAAGDVVKSPLYAIDVAAAGAALAVHDAWHRIERAPGGAPRKPVSYRRRAAPAG